MVLRFCYRGNPAPNGASMLQQRPLTMFSLFRRISPDVLAFGIYALVIAFAIVAYWMRS